MFTLPLSNSSRDPLSPDYVVPCYERNENGELLNENGEVDTRCLVCGYYREEKESWWKEGCELRDIDAVGAVCACTHLTVFSALLSGLVKELMCSNLDLLESVEQWKFGSSEPGRLLEAGGRDVSTGRWSDAKKDLTLS